MWPLSVGVKSKSPLTSACSYPLTRLRNAPINNSRPSSSGRAGRRNLETLATPRRPRVNATSFVAKGEEGVADMFPLQVDGFMEDIADEVERADGQREHAKRRGRSK